MSLRSLFGLALFLSLAACSSEPDEDARCEGESQSCVCDDGRSGQAACTDGSLGACACDGADGGDEDGGATSDGGVSDADERDAGGGGDQDGGDEDAGGELGCPLITQWPDGDGDGVGAAGSEAVEDCSYLDGYSLANTDCDDTNPDTYPFAPELCDQLDNDCDDEIDESTSAVEQWPDADGDGFGDPEQAPTRDCRPLDGFVRNDDDCDDEDDALRPDAEDVCDGIDNDCDEAIDEDAATALYWPDLDEDGYGDQDAVPEAWCAPPNNGVPNRDDCDDTDGMINPEGVEVCDLRDNNCDDGVDEGTELLVLYPDTDGDGFGDVFAAATLSCDPIEGFVSRQGDCDDTLEGVNPDASERCDDVDEDCDGRIDEDASDQQTWYADADQDGFGDPDAPLVACEAPARTVDNDQDCDDTDASIASGREEVCDGVDNNCDGDIDEGLTNACGSCGPLPEEVCGDFIDNDCDGDIDEPEAGCFCDGRTNQPCYPAEPQTLGIGACRGGVVSCSCPSGERFCEDGVYGECVGAIPPSVEICDGIDNDCDGRVDEGVRNACGTCDAEPVEVCDGLDNDCDGRVDEGLVNACGQCPGEESEEICNSFDDDCDGLVDEGCSCVGEEQPCYPGPPETLGEGVCAAGLRDCYATADFASVCVGAVLPGIEICNDRDDDCDGVVDVGPNGCSVCGTSEEICDGFDNNCDGFIDEGLRNDCGDCLDAVVDEELGGDALCNGLDDDCDGLIDEGLVNACGTCDEVCYLDGFDDDDDFDDGEGEGIDVDDGVRLDSSSFTFSDLWVANTLDDSVTRINTETGEVIATFSVDYNEGTGDDLPSRTAVDFDGNAWVANRAFDRQGSVAKITGGDCVTDCVEFIVPVGGTNGRPRGLAIDTDGDVWVGLDGAQRLVKLDGDDGSILGEWFLGIRTYGLAIDNTGIIWIATIDGGVIGAFDTNEESFLGSWSGDQCTRPYGIAVDGDGNVWAGNWTCGNLVRLDRASFDRGDRPPQFNYYGTGLSQTRGVAIDANNTVWLASSGNDRIVRFNRSTGAQLGTTATCSNPIGVGVANDGNVWTACYNDDQAERYGPDGAYIEGVDVGDAPYSYSDMTGFQLRNFTSPRGTWRTVFDCTFEDCSFDYVNFDVSMPAGTSVAVRVRSAEEPELWSAWTESFGTSPGDIRDVVPHGRYLQIEVQLATTTNGITPVLRSVDVEWQRP